MKKVELHNQPYSDDLGHRTFSLKGTTRFAACAVVILMATSAPSILADAPIYGYVGPTGQVSLTNVPTDEPVTAIRRKARYHSGVANLELEQAVIRAAQQHHVQPALLLAVMKAESSFNPTVISKAGAVGLMQLIPETAIRHGVRNLYDANDNITGGAKHLRYLLDRFHGNIRLALAAYNAGERQVDRYGQIPPYKETQDYVKKVLVYYRSYKKDGWIMPVVIAAPSMHAGRPY
ncbi:MAG: lytic transglycosylase domain-containing protein [Nitrospiraceae bacterium]|nr:lytic transglycosylase domain-containing protein [Nitrospiraceae bacterium]